MLRTAAQPSSPAYNSSSERDVLLSLQARAIQYFLDNQSGTGLMLDRQANFGAPRSTGLHSTAATGMGFIALALASAWPHRLVSRSEAISRVRQGLETAWHRLPHTRGVLPHFLDSTGAVCGTDARSTIDTGWLVAGGLWAARFLEDEQLQVLAERLFDRVDWTYWTGSGGLIHHGAEPAGKLLPCCWDRLNGETVFLYVLAAGAVRERAWPVEGWSRLGAFHGEVAGLRFASADLGLFVFQYGLDLLDLTSWKLPGELELPREAALATEANARICREWAATYQTYRHYWCLSAGDGPGEGDQRDTYRCYSPAGPLDGTALLEVSLAALEHRPALVWENVCRGQREGLLGHYGLANVNRDRGWVGQDLVGIDAGAAVLALDNQLHGNRVRQGFQALLPVRRGLKRLQARFAGSNEDQRLAG
jgi:hypothetical protein